MNRKAAPGEIVYPEVIGVYLDPVKTAEIVRDVFEAVALRFRFIGMMVFSPSSGEAMLRYAGSYGKVVALQRGLPIDLSSFPAASRVYSTDEVLTGEAHQLLPPTLQDAFSGQVAIVPLSMGSRQVGLLVGYPEKSVALGSDRWREEARNSKGAAAMAAEWVRMMIAYQDTFQQTMRTRAVAAAILEPQSLDQILDLISQSIAERLSVERIGIYFEDENGFRPGHLRNVPEAYATAVTKLAPIGPLLQKRRASHLPFVVQNVQEREAYRPVWDLMRQEGVHSVVVAPFQYGAKVRGIVCLYPREIRQFSHVELAALKVFSDQLALAVAFSHYFEEQRIASVAEERHRLARELHDTLAQSLSVIILQLEAMQSVLRDPLQLTDLLSETQQMARDALEETRRSVLGLSPIPLERLSLPDALSQELEMLERQSGVRTAFASSGTDVDMSEEAKTTLFRIAQEALSNARKHAQASRVRIALDYSSDGIKLAIEDDGDGFDVHELKSHGVHSGYGLFSMEERARSVGGELDIDSTPRWGTRITIRIPVRRDEAVPVHPAVSTLKHRIILVDDHDFARQALRRILEGAGEFTVVAEASDGVAAQNMVAQQKPDLVLMDVQMPQQDGLATLGHLKRNFPELPVIMVTSLDDAQKLADSIRLGANGYLLKSAPSEEMLGAIRGVLRGERRFPGPTTARMAEQLREEKSSPSSVDLNEREIEVLSLLTTGARNKEIAETLFVSTKTVEAHLSHIFAKLGVSNRTEAAKVAIERSLIG